MNKKNGFTLVEAIIVVVLLGVLVGVSIKGVYTWIDKAKVKTDINNVKEIEDAFNTCLQDEEFPIGEKGYCFVMISNSESATGGLFGDYILIRPDIAENWSVGTSRTYLIDGKTDKGLELYNGNIALISDFKDKILKSLKRKDDRVISKMSTKYKMFCVISIDEGGNFVQAKCGLTNLPNWSSVDYYEGLAGLYYYKKDEICGNCKNYGNVMKKQYIVYDGNIDVLS